MSGRRAVAGEMGRLRFSVCSDTGRVRPDNQDAYCAEWVDQGQQRLLLAVADGMGGHAAGEVASELAVRALREQAQALAADQWLNPTECQEGLRQAALAAHARILAAQEENPALRGMGTTLTVALVWGDHITIAHTGDSRLYLVQDGQTVQCTNDHSVVGELLRQGELSEAEAMVHPHRNLLTSALGSQGDVHLDVLTVQWRPGDFCLLCTDGLSNLVTAAEISQAAAEPHHWPTLAQRLVDLANDRGGHDNITVVAAWRAR